MRVRVLQPSAIEWADPASRRQARPGATRVWLRGDGTATAWPASAAGSAAPDGWLRRAWAAAPTRLLQVRAVREQQRAVRAVQGQPGQAAAAWVPQRAAAAAAGRPEWLRLQLLHRARLAAAILAGRSAEAEARTC
jgi:hypothetical protein